MVPNVYSPAQKAAAVRLIIEEGLSPKAAVARLAEGVDGLEPFAMNAESARIEAGKVRRRREEESDREVLRMMRLDDPDAALLELYYRLLDATGVAVRRLVQSESPDAEETGRWLRNVVTLRREIGGRPRPVKEKERASNLVDLESRLRERQGGAAA